MILTYLILQVAAEGLPRLTAVTFPTGEYPPGMGYIIEISELTQEICGDTKQSETKKNNSTFCDEYKSGKYKILDQVDKMILLVKPIFSLRSNMNNGTNQIPNSSSDTSFESIHTQKRIVSDGKQTIVNVTNNWTVIDNVGKVKFNKFSINLSQPINWMFNKKSNFSWF